MSIVYVMLCHAMPCHAMLCYAMLCYAMLHYAMLCYAILCYAKLCYAINLSIFPLRILPQYFQALYKYVLGELWAPIRTLTDQCGLSGQSDMFGLLIWYKCVWSIQHVYLGTTQILIGNRPCILDIHKGGELLGHLLLESSL